MEDKNKWKLRLADAIIAQAAVNGHRILLGAIYIVDGCVWVTTANGKTSILPQFTPKKVQEEDGSDPDRYKRMLRNGPGGYL